ncbi:hypothetical protein RND81_13G163200 [Saponaria officinalis]|uniref:Glycosyltransferase n=1 Tax=Saponaria officinalis TaxID=3572 RepID=A0AAW1H0N2_SAPOF
MTRLELVIVPTPGMGHLLSMVEFAKRITDTNPNISIIVIVYHMSIFEPSKIASYIESQSSRLDPTRITFITLPPLENPPDPSDPSYFGTLIQLQNPLLKKAVQDRQVKPAAFILDLINVSMIDVANDLRVPSYIYFTGGVNFLYTMFHFQALVDAHGVDDISGLVGDPDSELDLPGFRNRVPVKVVPYMFLDKEFHRPKFVMNLARRFREAKGILVNSFTELEFSTIEALNKMDNIPTIYPVGPMLSLNNRGDAKPSNKDDISCNVTDEDNIISWLDGQPESSVVFLCFGSMGYFDTDQVTEIANGLDQSGHRFLWSLRKPVQDESLGNKAEPSENEIFEEALPEGFIDRTAHKGKIIPWAPQVTVLAHKSIGGFVSHCGWNSILESLWFGVPIATWPMYSEQQLNAFTLVKELELAVEIKLDYRWDFKTGNYLVTAEEVENGVRKVMDLEEEMKTKVHEMRGKCRRVLEADGGSSYDSLARFIEEVTHKSQ